MLTASIDLDAPGKHHGFLGLIHSDHRHAHSVIPIPVSVVNGGDGPTVLITAGVHGDKYAGIAAVRQLIAELDPEAVTGRVILLPQLNYPACLENTRVSPLDGENLNRVFPGAANGSPTGQIAHYLEETLLPQVDFAVDLHSGGTTARYVPSGFLYRRDGDLMDAKLAAARAFGLATTLVVDAPISAGSLLGACDRTGVPAIAAEISGGATLEREPIAAGRAGLYRLLVHWGVLETAPDDVPAGVETSYVRLAFGPDRAVVAPVSGLVVPQQSIGDAVRAGEVAARLYPMEDQGAPPLTLHFPQDGVVTSMIARADVRRGDFVYLTGVPIDL